MPAVGGSLNCLYGAVQILLPGHPNAVCHADGPHTVGDFNNQVYDSQLRDGEECLQLTLVPSQSRSDVLNFGSGLVVWER
eukprot:1120889-Karenia_brevis.AAC.1